MCSQQFIFHGLCINRHRLQKISPEGKDMVEKMLEIDPAKRISASEV